MRRPEPLTCSGPAAAERLAADLTNHDRLIQITKGVDALYNCAGAPYTRWPQEWPPMAASLLTTAEATSAVLVTAGNLYGYGPADRPMTEDMPLAATGVKGRVRVQMWADALAAHEAGRARVAEVRSSDYFGPGASDQTPAGTRFVPPLLAGRRVTFLGDPGVPQPWTYLPDVAAAMATAATDERAWGRPWHVPTAPAVSARALAVRLCGLAGAPTPPTGRDPVRRRARVPAAARAEGDPLPVRPAIRHGLVGLREHLRTDRHAHRRCPRRHYRRGPYRLTKAAVPITQETFAQAQQIFAADGRGSGPRARTATRNRYLLRGCVYCGVCERKMQGLRRRAPAGGYGSSCTIPRMGSLGGSSGGRCSICSPRFWNTVRS
jgi:nucleoside-diphosphate-sugar epimerase